MFLNYLDAFKRGILIEICFVHTIGTVLVNILCRNCENANILNPFIILQQKHNKFTTNALSSGQKSVYARSWLRKCRITMYLGMIRAGRCKAVGVARCIVCLFLSDNRTTALYDRDMLSRKSNQFYSLKRLLYYIFYVYFQVIIQKTTKKLSL